MNDGRMEHYIRIKERAGRLEIGEDDLQKTWEEYFEDIYNVVTVTMCGF